MAQCSLSSYGLVTLQCVTMLHFVYSFISLQTFGLFTLLSNKNNTAVTFVYKFLHKHTPSFILGMYLGVEFLDPVLTEILK